MTRGILAQVAEALAVAHAGYEGRRIGHGPQRGHLQDEPWRPENIGRAKQMAREAYEQMRQNAQKLKCCKGSPANGCNVQWDKVDQFLSIEYGNFFRVCMIRLWKLSDKSWPITLEGIRYQEEWGGPE